MSILSRRSATDVKLPLDLLGNVRTNSKTGVITLQSVYGLSALRDTVTTSGTGSVSNTIGQSEFTMSVTGATDSAALTSRERGRHSTGFAAEISIGVRIPVAMTGNQVGTWGYYDSLNGMYFKQSSSGMYACVLRNGSETAIPQTAWNVDPMNGTGPSGQTLDVTRGNVFRVLFTWCGYEAIVFEIGCTNPDGTTLNVIVHSYVTGGQTSVTNPNLPLNTSISNNGTATAKSIYVAGRQFALLGNANPVYRVTSPYRVEIGTSSSWVPYLSVRKRTNYNSVCVKLLSMDVSSTSDVIVSVRASPTLTGATFVAGVPDTVSTETSLDVDTAATAIANGIVVFTGMVGSGRNTTFTFTSEGEDFQYTLSENEIVSVLVRDTGDTGITTVVLRLREEY